MALNATDIPALSFPRNEIIEIIPASYNNEATRIMIPGIDDIMIPASPEDIKIPVPPSGTITRKAQSNIVLSVVMVTEKARYVWEETCLFTLFVLVKHSKWP